MARERASPPPWTHRDSNCGEDASRALLRKVSQLTKVVMHLNAKNDEGESRYEALREKFEKEIEVITEDAAQKIRTHKQLVAELSDPSAANREVEQRAEVWRQRRDETRSRLEEARHEVVDRREQLLHQGRMQLEKATGELKNITKEIRASVDAFRETTGRSKQELQRHNAEFQEKRSDELRAIAEEHTTRLGEVREQHAKEVQQLRDANMQELTHVRRLHDSETSSLQMQQLQKRREKIQRLEQDFRCERRSIEQNIAHMVYELGQQKRDAEDTASTSENMQQQIEAMRVALEEMTKRVSQAEVEAARAQEEAKAKEEEAAALARELNVLIVRQRASGVESPAPTGARAAAVAASAVGLGLWRAESQSERSGAKLSEDVEVRTLVRAIPIASTGTLCLAARSCREVGGSPRAAAQPRRLWPGSMVPIIRPTPGPTGLIDLTSNPRESAGLNSSFSPPTRTVP